MDAEELTMDVEDILNFTIDEIINLSDEDSIVEEIPEEEKEIPEEEKEPTIIYWVDRFNITSNKKFNEITHDEINNFDFKHNTFNEVLKEPEYVRPYFDVDNIKTEEEYLDLINWLDSLTSVFKTYSIGGYTNNQEMLKYGFKLQTTGGHFLSLHIVFYEVKVKAKLMIELMKHTEKSGYINYEVSKYLDPAPYKLSKRQIFRHVLSNKRVNQETCKKSRGKILNNKLPETNIIQIKGNELELFEDDIIKVIPKKKKSLGAKPLPPATIASPKEHVEPKTTKEPKNKDPNVKEIEWEDHLIMFTKEQMLEFLDCFNPEFDNLLTTLAPLRYSPYTYSFLHDVLIEWYGQREHHNGTINVVEQVLGSYYSYTPNNKWFFSILRHLPDKLARIWLKIVNVPVDFTINFNNSHYSIDRIYQNKYSINNFGYLINDLRKCYGFFEDRFFIKRKDGDQFKVKEVNSVKIQHMFEMYKPITENKEINLYQIVRRYSDYFKYIDAKFMAYPTEEEQNDYINLFQGFKYIELKTYGFEMLQPLLDHVKNIICNGDEDKYDYLMKWWANIFQNITVKNCSMPIIYGAQGSGKSIFVEIMCELLGSYGLRNCDDLDKVFGKFNVLNTKYLAIVINEPPDANDKFKFTGKIKSKITQNQQTVECKGIDPFDLETWTNYIMTTNNPNPIMEERGNRRVIYYETNNSKCGDFNYFKELLSPIQPITQGPYNKSYMGTLLYYMRSQIDITDWNPEELIRKINDTTNIDYNEQLERQLNDLNRVEKFVVENYHLFLKGFALDNIPTLGEYTPDGIGRKLQGICTCERRRNKYVKELYASDVIYIDYIVNEEYEKHKVYKLKPEEQIPDLYKLIKYYHYEPEEEPEEELEVILD